MQRDIFQAIADPTRRAILVLAAAKALTLNALAGREVRFHTETISRHSHILGECNLVMPEARGREIYTLEIGQMKQIDVWLEQFRKIWIQRFDQLDPVLQQLKQSEK